jgi:hypothetical protein
MSSFIAAVVLLYPYPEQIARRIAEYFIAKYRYPTVVL